MTLKEWMTLQGITVKELADELDLSLAIVYDWLKGVKRPSKTNMPKLIALSEGKIDANTFF